MYEVFLKLLGSFKYRIVDNKSSVSIELAEGGSLRFSSLNTFRVVMVREPLGTIVGEVTPGKG